MAASTLVRFNSNSVSILFPAAYHACLTLISGIMQREALEAYVRNGEGIDRAGGFAAQVCVVEHEAHTADNVQYFLPCLSAPSLQQGLGGILVESVQGDYNNVAGFPTYPFWRWLNGLYEEGAFDE